MDTTKMPLVGTLYRAFAGMKPLKEKKSPIVAFLMGFAFGPFGTGIYLATWEDFFLAFSALVVLFIVIPGIGVVPGWLFSGAYATLRVIASNEKLKAQMGQGGSPSAPEDKGVSQND